MCALIIMAVHDTEDNGRSKFTSLTLRGLVQTADLNKHRLIVVDNGSYEGTKEILKHCELFKGIQVITLPENIGTARAVNRGLQLRASGEYCIKIDNDVIIHQPGWVDQMEDVMRRMPQLGILGLKRVDLLESPYAINTDQRSRLLMVPHETGQRWRIVEECKHVMGTCTMLSPALLDRVGFFYQMDGLYGFDDSLMCVRSQVAGFVNCFLPHIDIDHIDPGGTPYTKWKEDYAGTMLSRYTEAEAAYVNGVRDVRENA